MQLIFDEAHRISANSVADLTRKIAELGKPFPLKQDGEQVAWLVANQAMAARCPAGVAVYTPAEACFLARIPVQDAQMIHQLKRRLGVTIHPDTSGDDDTAEP